MVALIRIISLLAGIFTQWPTGGGSSQAGAPVFMPPGFSSNCHGSQSVSITSPTTGTTIHYTTNGTTPDCHTGTPAPNGVIITIPAHAIETVLAVAFTTCSDTSNVSEADYDFSCG
jgi:hypothetical protein